MSHFSVLILGDDPELQLDPFAELSAMDGPSAENYRAVFSVEVYKEDFAATAHKILERAESEGKGDIPGIRALIEREAYETLFADWFGGDLGPDGDWGYFENPEAKWDWFVLGGRWQGQLHLLPGPAGRGSCGERSWCNEELPTEADTCDQARAGDIDWAATRREFTPFAVLKDGEWYEQGEMGWWGAVTDPKAEAAWAAEVDALLKDLPPTTLVSVYDCHI